VIILVVNLHACVTYSHVGDWYFKSEREPSLAEKVPFILWEAHLQAFFMGLLFFVSGYFAYISLTRHGPKRFALERLFRLGLPSLLYMLLIHPFIVLVLNPWSADFGAPGVFYVKYITTGQVLGSTGPLWFAVALLLFCLLLTGSSFVWLRQSLNARYEAARQAALGATVAPPNLALLLIVGFTLGFGTFAVRILQPIGTNVLNMQLCYFVQYVAFFIFGIHAASHGWLLPLAVSPLARATGWITLLGGPVVLSVLMFLGIQDGKVEVFFGGWHWQALGLALWEQFAGIGLSLGALALFARKVNRQTPQMRWLDERSFAVYVLHAPLLIGLAMLFRALPQSMYGLVALLTVTGLLASYIIADLIRRVPLFRAIL
jgi:fucose 4-O-acetylase-like acetyltransferase